MLSVLAVIVILLILIFLIIPLFRRKEYVVQQKVVINNPTSVVFDFVKLLGNQVYYNKWVMMDPNVKRTTSGRWYSWIYYCMG